MLKLSWENYLRLLQSNASSLPEGAQIDNIFSSEYQAFIKDESLGEVEVLSLRGIGPFTLKRTIARLSSPVEFEIRLPEPIFTVGFLFRGRFQFHQQSGEESQVFVAPQIIMYRQAEPLSFQRIDNDEAYETLNISFDDRTLQRFLEKDLQGRAILARLNREKYVLARPEDQFLGALFNQLNLISLRRNQSEIFLAESLILKILDKTLQWLRQPEGQPDTDKYSAVFYAILQYMRKNLNHTLSAQEVQAHFGVSKNWLQNRFKEELHTSFSEYLSQLRLRRAYDLLQVGSEHYSVKQVSELLSFRSSTTFAAKFKAYFGCSPSEVQRMAH